MKELKPYLRFIARTSSLPNKRYTIAYDCRFLYVLSGRGRILVDGRELSLEPDTLLYYPPGIRYHLQSESSNPMQFITVNFDFTDGYGERGVLRPVFTENYNPTLLQPSHIELGEERFADAFIINDAEGVRPYLIKMLEAKRDEGIYSDKLSSALLCALILEILQRENSRPVNNKIVLQAMTYVRDNFSKSLTNTTLAKALKYHPYYLGALFRQYLGKTPHEYIDEVRLNHASELLSLTDDSIYEIAACCGYKTAEHFTRRFKLRYGASPTEWRNHRRLI